MEGGLIASQRLALAMTAGALVVGIAAVAASAAERDPRIVNGRPAPPGAFPFMAALVIPDKPAEDGEFCGGALIAPRIVLTAAHCIEGSAPRELQVVVGRSSLSDRDGQRIRVAKIAENPDAQLDRELPASDAAQVWLKERAVVAPLGLVGPADAALFAGGQPAHAVGWGVIGERSVEQPDQLYEADVAFVSQRDCRHAYGPAFERATMLCASAPGIDTCYGDSGSPLLVPNPAGGWLGAGIVSSGRGCARPKYPGTYAKVAALRGFIDDREPVFAPFNTERPFPTGLPAVGHRLHCHKGNWHGEVRRYAFRWVIVRAGEPRKVVGAGRRWTGKGRYQGAHVSCQVFGLNDGGYSSARSRGVRVRREGFAD